MKRTRLYPAGTMSGPPLGHEQPVDRGLPTHSFSWKPWGRGMEEVADCRVIHKPSGGKFSRS